MSTTLKQCLLLFCCVSLFYVIMLGTRPLNTPDEARYAEIPREMVVNHDYVTPRLDQIKYFEKPVLFYWWQAAAIKSFGLSEWSLRLPNCLAAIFTILATFLASKKLFDERRAWQSALILAIAPLFYFMGHMVTLDMPLTLFMSSSLLAFITAIQYPAGTTRRLLFYLLYASCGAAVLTKGLVGLLLPGAIIFSWFCCTRSWRELRHSYLGSGSLIFLAITLPWHILVGLRNPEFWRFYFLDQQFLRYFTEIAKRSQPIWFFIPIIILGLFPWSGFLIQSLIRAGKSFKQPSAEAKARIFLLLWASIIFIFFSLSQSKLIPYILPAMPAFAILLADYLCATQSSTRTIRIGWWLSSILAITIIAAEAFVIYQQQDITITHITLTLLSSWLALSAIAAFCCWQALARSPSQQPSLWLAICLLPVLLSHLYAIPKIDDRSIKPLLQQIHLRPEDQLISYSHYYQDLPFYARRTVYLVDPGGELRFGLQQQTPRWVLSKTDFWQHWHEPPRKWLFIRQKDYQRLSPSLRSQLVLVGKLEDNIVARN